MKSNSPTLVREQGLPLHHQVYLTLRELLRSGRYKQGDLFPTEEMLSADFGVSRITIRRALDALARDSLIERRQGRGTFVGDISATAAPLGLTLTQINRQSSIVGQTTEARVVEFDQVFPPAEIADLFGIEPGGKIQRAVRVRLREGVPIFHLTTFVADRVARTFTRKDMEKEALFELIKAAGVQLASGHQIVTATLADPLVAQRLNVMIGEPLVRMIRILRDEQGHPIEHLDMLASPERFQLHFSLEKDSITSLHESIGGGWISAKRTKSADQGAKKRR
ncbi:GntR family transcriptional regulator [Bradyrhizobium sp. LHD-71]|uniref:GntR family transcriptional regulator n=1 Tax=Bradyrhizobium sp. LHD-71 TaxID=3072141 RepID=UPI00280C940F|nr:GntR family transcriptional regulator [Bradyrhizobium sp. LHD-71]MDQ8728486.1 GntR family transcriptional regulator [Bradyrhizobium sp. LHD-71]